MKTRNFSRPALAPLDESLALLQLPMGSFLLYCLRLFLDLCTDVWSTEGRSYLFQEKLIHALQVAGAGDDLQGVILPLHGLQSHVADLDAALTLHFGRGFLVLLEFPPVDARQLRTPWGRQVMRTQLCWS